ncbi:hypothetical protein [Sphingobacterium detergens]|nr:hypothetical protein [Sphingobacterium detergens]
MHHNGMITVKYKHEKRQPEEAAFSSLWGPLKEAGHAIPPV